MSEDSGSPVVLAIGNRKGGVGKTSLTLLIAQTAAARGRRVLLVDADPQANLTSTLGVEGEYNLFDVLYAGEAGTMGQAIVPTEWPGIDIVPSHESLHRIDVEALLTPEMRMKTAAWGSKELEGYDLVLVDLPPNLGRLTLNGLLWATHVLAVTEAAAFSVQGLKEFLETVEQVKSLPHLNPNLRSVGIVVNKFDSRTADGPFQLEALEKAYGDDILKPVLHLRAAVQDMESSHTPLAKIRTRSSVNIMDDLALLVPAIERRISNAAN